MPVKPETSVCGSEAESREDCEHAQREKSAVFHTFYIIIITVIIVMHFYFALIVYFFIFMLQR